MPANLVFIKKAKKFLKIEQIRITLETSIGLCTSCIADVSIINQSPICLGSTLLLMHELLKHSPPFIEERFRKRSILAGKKMRQANSVLEKLLRFIEKHDDNRIIFIKQLESLVKPEYLELIERAIGIAIEDNKIIPYNEEVFVKTEWDGVLLNQYGPTIPVHEAMRQYLKSKGLRPCANRIEEANYKGESTQMCLGRTVGYKGPQTSLPNFIINNMVAEFEHVGH